MNLLELVNTIASELSGERAKKITGQLSQYHRIQASKEFLTAVEFVQEELKKLRDKNSKIHEYVADGTNRYFDWSTPISWDIEDGELSIIEPIKKKICQYSEVPESICTHSKSVDLTAEIIHIGGGTPEEMEGKEIKGKIVLTSGSPRSMIDELDEHGAIGIIAYPSEQQAQGYLHMIRYVGLWPNAENLDKSTFGFSISRKQALELIKLLKKGTKVLVHAKIKANLYEGKMHVLSTKIDGSESPNEEIILVTHICHPAPSANDNASGSALLLEVYRTIISLIRERKIEKPHRTIRFLWVPEFHGTIPWIEEQIKQESFKPIYCINLDMVGEHPALVGYPFTFNKASVSTPSYLNDLISEIIELVKDNPLTIEQGGWQFPWNYRSKPFAGGSDHLLFNEEPIRIPSVMFGHPDTFHHTNLDTIEKVDPTTLKRVGTTTVATVIASVNKHQFSNEILKAFAKQYQIRKGKFTNLLTNELLLAETSEEKERKLEHTRLIHRVFEQFVGNEEKAFETVTNSFTDIDTFLLKIIKKDLKELAQFYSDFIPHLSEMEKKTEGEKLLKKIPIRKWDGPLSYRYLYNVEKAKKENEEVAKMGEERLQRVEEFLEAVSANYNGFLFELLSLIDGRKTTEEIISLLSLIQWKIPQVKAIFDYLEMIEHLGLIEMKDH